MTEFPLQVWPGHGTELGAGHDGQGVNFAVFSEHATAMEVCLYNPSDPSRELGRFRLPERTRHVWHGYVPGLRPGVLYGFRAHGPYDPGAGLLFNPQKLLVDPYARAILGKVDQNLPVFGYRREALYQSELKMDEQDDARGKPRSVVVADDFDWGADAKPEIPWYRTVIYELHVKGFTKLHPEVPPELRGTYAGLATPAAIKRFKELGITAVELLPVHEHVDEGTLTSRGLSNYWGYSTLGYFAPEQSYSSRGGAGAQVSEFKQMVKALHAEGIEVILDVVYNHTGEGNQLGPTVSFKGLDNPVYYRLSPEDPRNYLDYTGTGNSLNTGHPQTLKLVADSLRYWVQEMRVDGFRFDLTTTLGREQRDFDPRAPFFQLIHQDPVLSRVKLIAEPWDLGPGGYQLGNFPVLWSEWNGKYRDAVRRYWRGDGHTVAELGYRLAGSSDLFQHTSRRPSASVNFIIAHDGFTLHDLVSYSQKHNENNGEDNRDGENDNHSWNCGIEGETDDPKVRAIREQLKRNLIATLFLSQGIPMLCAGDEVGRTQRGNNNAYCQDNEISWLDWKLDDAQRSLLDFTAKMIRIRWEQPVLHRRAFFQGSQIWDSRFKDLAWFRPDGLEMTPSDWQDAMGRSIGFLLGGDAIPVPDGRGIRVVGDTLLVLMNANTEPLRFTLPAIEWGVDWESLVDTSRVEPAPGRKPAGAQVELAGRSVMVLRHPSSSS
jgi:glycogen operon protein